jgi:hypothetical protein
MLSSGTMLITQALIRGNNIPTLDISTFLIYADVI